MLIIRPLWALKGKRDAERFLGRKLTLLQKVEHTILIFGGSLLFKGERKAFYRAGKLFALADAFDDAIDKRNMLLFGRVRALSGDEPKFWNRAIGVIKFKVKEKKSLISFFKEDLFETYGYMREAGKDLQAISPRLWKNLRYLAVYLTFLDDIMDYWQDKERGEENSLYFLLRKCGEKIGSDKIVTMRTIRRCCPKTSAEIQNILNNLEKEMDLPIVKFTALSYRKLGWPIKAIMERAK